MIKNKIVTLDSLIGVNYSIVWKKLSELFKPTDGKCTVWSPGEVQSDSNEALFLSEDVGGQL